jgi:hypothetical protein
MQRKTSNVVVKVARALCTVLGAPPFALRAPVPAVVLVATHSLAPHERAALYHRRYSRYLAAIGDDHT